MTPTVDLRSGGVPQRHMRGQRRQPRRESGRGRIERVKKEPSLLDRFVCRREGHRPTVYNLKAAGMVTPKTYLTTCKRCGKTYEEKFGA